MADLDDILADRLGPSPVAMLQRVIEEQPGMAAAVVVYETSDGKLVAASGGCTMLETLGLLQFASHWAAKAVTPEE